MKPIIKPKVVDPARSAAAGVMGRVGGRAATGDKKRRPPEHYQAMVEQRAVQRGIEAAAEAEQE